MPTADRENAPSRADDEVVLYGYRFSVYTRAARLVLIEKVVGHRHVEIDPFSADVPSWYTRLQPFGRVPALCHGNFAIHETAAIARYVEAAFPGPALLPGGPRALARVAQVIGTVDAHGYWPMVRQVFAHAVFRPLAGEASDPEEIAAGLRASAPVLDALEGIAREGLVLDGELITLADCHLAPVVACFALCEDGTRALAARPRLARWWAAVSARDPVRATDPDFAATVPRS